jgi:hypothetical protein
MDVLEHTEYNSNIEFIETCDPEFLQILVKKQKTIKEKFGFSDKVLLIYDDCISETKFFNSNVVKKMFFNSRHLNISTIITSQNYKSLSKPLRLNQTQLILFFSANEMELKLIYEENASSLGFKKFLEIFREITERPFGFLVINYQNDILHRIQDNFKRFIL